MQLTKHHGLGNDFLVALDPPRPLTPEDARRWCDRRRGVGADGLLIGTSAADPDADIAMVLFNADGSLAEMSGNGIRCLVQAELRRRGLAAGQVRVRTDAGLRIVDARATEDPLTVWASVDMGAAPVEPIDGRSSLVDVGNPHLVVLGGDVLELGLAHPDRNVEVVEVVARDHVRMAVHERGVGLTEACGTGACAAAAATRAWGLVDDEVRVEMPGGTVEVLVGASVTLRGPATFVATVEVADA